jgi:hypothetical protein
MTPRTSESRAKLGDIIRVDRTVFHYFFLGFKGLPISFSLFIAATPSSNVYLFFSSLSSDISSIVICCHVVSQILRLLRLRYQHHYRQCSFTVDDDLL